MHFLGRTTKFEEVGLDRVKQYMKEGRGLILAIWHGRTMLPIYYCRGLGFWAITSLSRDGELQTRTISRFGYQIIRGSTGRGGVKAALTACKRLQEGGVLAITPDGPKGPAFQVQEGTIFLAQHAGCDIIPVGVGLTRRRLMRAWDKYAVPLPFGRCGLVFGEPISLQEAVDGLSPEERIRLALDAVQRQAQEMVKEG